MKRKKVCIIGLGFVGSVMSVATAISKKMENIILTLPA